jgi:hypothetical protein
LPPSRETRGSHSVLAASRNRRPQTGGTRLAEGRFEIEWSTLPLPAAATTTNALTVIANIAMQDPRHVARAVRFALTQPRESVVAEITVLPVQESSWP